MNGTAKNWLVRTRTGEILGPFSQNELVEELEKKSFSTQDEIAQSGGKYWVSAASLSHRDIEEVTRTSTRHTGTRSITENPEPSSIQSGPKQIILDDFTPTPETPENRAYDLHSNLPPTKSEQSKARVGPIITGVVVSLVAITLLFQFNPRKDFKSATNLTTLSAGNESESPFVRQIYTMINSGETATALKKLNEYHEKVLKKESLDYLVPYAALLIIEGESIGRAKKFLEQILSSPSTPQLKARAHHWLGYLLLSQDEADMGESHFLESLQLNPKDAAARFNLGRAYLKQEKYSQALDYLQLAELEIPDLWLVHIYKGRAKVALGNLEEARTSFKTAIATAPDCWISYIYYALYLNGIRDYDEARNTLQQMLTRDPHYELHSPAPMGYYQEKVNYSEYLSAFNTVMEKGPPEEKELGKLYINYLMSGGTDNDIKKLQTLADKGSLLPKVLQLKILLDKRAGTSPEVKTLLSKLPASLKTMGPYAYVLRGEAKARLGLVGDAQEDFQEALKLDPKSAVAHWALASIYERLGKKDDAQNEIRTLRGFHPSYIPAILTSPNF